MQDLAWISSDYFESLLLPQLLRGENDSKQSDEFQAMQDLVSQIYVPSMSFFVSYCHINENYYKSVTSTTFNTNYPKYPAEKGYNEGRERQIGQTIF